MNEFKIGDIVFIKEGAGYYAELQDPDVFLKVVSDIDDDGEYECKVVDGNKDTFQTTYYPRPYDMVLVPPADEPDRGIVFSECEPCTNLGAIKAGDVLVVRTEEMLDAKIYVAFHKEIDKNLHLVLCLEDGQFYKLAEAHFQQGFVRKVHSLVDVYKDINVYI